MLILFKAVHPENASFPMDSTVFGMITEGNFVQPLKQLTPITEHPSLIVRLVSAVQLRNTPVAMLATFEPIVTEVRLVQPINCSPSYSYN